MNGFSKEEWDAIRGAVVNECSRLEDVCLAAAAGGLAPTPEDCGRALLAYDAVKRAENDSDWGNRRWKRLREREKEEGRTKKGAGA